MKITPFVRLLLPLALLTSATYAATPTSVRPLGNNTFEITRQASSGFTRDTDKLKAEALDAAAAYCAHEHRELKVVSATTEKPSLMFTGYAKARVVFKALNPDDPELRAPVVAASPTAPASLPTSSASYVETPTPRTATDALYNDLLKLDDLRKRGILTDEEFQAQKKKLLER